MYSRPLFVRSPLHRLTHRQYRGHHRAPSTMLGPLLLGIGLALGAYWVAANTTPTRTPEIAPAAAVRVALDQAAGTGTLVTRGYDVVYVPVVKARPPAARPARPPARASRSVARPTKPRPAARPTSRPAARPAARPARSSRVSAGRWVRPSGGPLTSCYCYRWGRFHKGIDLGARYGSGIFAAFDGVVVSAGWDGGYGKTVVVRHTDGTVTKYAHASSILVSRGTKVAAGQVIARVGSTGYSTGPHLHFEVHRSGRTVNPLPFLRARGVRI